MLHQSQLQKQTTKISPQVVQLLGIYHLNTIDLEQRIRDEMDDNPLLEKVAEEEVSIEATELNGEPPEFQNWEEYGYDDIPNYIAEHQAFLHHNATNVPLKDTPDIRRNLKQQLINLNLDEKENNIALFIIDGISDDGFLERSVAEIADDYSFINTLFVEEERVQAVIHKIQTLEPIGIACTCIRDFFLKQLEQLKSSPVINKCIELIRDHYVQLQKRQFEKICADLHIDHEELSIVLKQIANLRLRPINLSSDDQLVKQTIIPDFIMSVDGEQIMVELYQQKGNTLSINDSLANCIETTVNQTAEQKATAQYLKGKLSAAQWFIDAIREREGNMLKIMRTIVKRQFNYFISGNAEDIQPMVLKDIAASVGLDISTVSRVTCNKYIDTPFGLIHLKKLFSEGLVNDEGVSISNKVIQTKLKEIIEMEDRSNPYNDHQLVGILSNDGIKVARRTISKYREIMDIPVGAMRKLWSLSANNEA